MRDSLSRPASWVLGRLLPARDLEAVLGDLAEEYVLRSRSTSPSSVSRWYWSQICRSIPPLLWVSIRRGGWLITLGVAIGAHIVSGIVEFAGVTAMSTLVAPNARVQAALSLVLGLTTIVLGGYFAEWIRQGAATALAMIVATVVPVLMVTMGDSSPLWYQIVFLAVGPLAALAGGAVRARSPSLGKSQL